LKLKVPIAYSKIIEASHGLFAPCLTSFLFTCFTTDLDYDTGKRLFENFLLYGEPFLIGFIYKCIKIKQKKIKSMNECEVMSYVKYKMIEECY